MNRDADVIVIGSGVSGASAFIEASANGARVLGIDAGDRFGGTARLAGGGVCVPGSAMQRELGIEDTPELALADLSANGHDFDRDWAETYFRNASQDVFEWLRGCGATFERIMHFEGESVPRFHRPRGGGAGLMGALWEHCRRNGLEGNWRFGLRLTDLIREDDKVTGIVCIDGEGAEHRFHAAAIIVAIGGFSANLDEVRRHARHLDGAPRVLAGGGPGARGEGIAILQRHGAKFDHLGDVYCYATGIADYRAPDQDRGVVMRANTGWLWLNRKGERFHDESQMISGNLSVPRLLAQPDATAWAIFDETMLADITIDDHFVEPGTETSAEAARRHLAHSPHVWRAGALAELFAAAGIDAEGGLQTVEAWNRQLASGAEKDPLTGRRLAGLRPLAAAPFHAVQFFPIARKSMGGVQTDRACRVLREADGNPLPGLYASGETAGMAGGHIGGIKPLEGMMVGPSCFSGRIAGRMAAAHALAAAALA